MAIARSHYICPSLFIFSSRRMSKVIAIDNSVATCNMFDTLTLLEISRLSTMCIKYTCNWTHLNETFMDLLWHFVPTLRQHLNTLYTRTCIEREALVARAGVLSFRGLTARRWTIYLRFTRLHGEKWHSFVSGGRIFANRGNFVAAGLTTVTSLSSSKTDTRQRREWEREREREKALFPRRRTK